MKGIVFIALTIVFSSGVALTIKAANHQRVNLGHFLVVNYAVCTASLMVSGGWRLAGSISPQVWLLGIFVGCMYVVCLWLFDRAITAAGLALSTTLMRLSAAIPTLGSLIFYAEQTGIVQIAGMALAFCCLPLASREPLISRQGATQALKGMSWGILLFLAYGITDFSFKILAEMEPAADPKAFMVPIFSTALLVTLPALFKKGKPDKLSLMWGALLGAVNVLTTYFWFRALAHIPGSVAFPTLGLGVIAITTLAGLTIWHEKLRAANYFFLALACISVFLINF
ncbi:MAG: EamA family transporter [Thermodesulfobacteriota bacterium]